VLGGRDQALADRRCAFHVLRQVLRQVRTARGGRVLGTARRCTLGAGRCRRLGLAGACAARLRGGRPRLARGCAGLRVLQRRGLGWQVATTAARRRPLARFRDGSPAGRSDWPPTSRSFSCPPVCRAKRLRPSLHHWRPIRAQRPSHRRWPCLRRWCGPSPRRGRPAPRRGRHRSSPERCRAR
jgi:hypothetical protein